MEQLWLIATLEQFAQYGIPITVERKLSDGRYIKHIELSSPWIPSIWGVESMKPITQGELDEILSNEPIE